MGGPSKTVHAPIILRDNPWCCGSFLMKRKEYLSCEYVRQCFEYVDGTLVWKNRPRDHFNSDNSWKGFNTRFAGKDAGVWFTRKRGDKEDTRCTIYINGKDYKRHLLVWIFHGNEPPNNEQHVDHKDLDTTNDRIENLRLATRSQSMANRRIFSNNTTGYRGVYYREGWGKWRARIQVNKKNIHLGDYSTKEEAYQAYLDAAKKYFGDFMVA